MTLSIEQLHRYAPDPNYVYIISGDLNCDTCIREPFQLTKLAGDTTRAVRPIQWWFNPNPAGNKPDPHGFVKLGYGFTLAIRRDQIPPLELGGNINLGMIHPNINIRPGPRVDAVHDLNITPFPVYTESVGFVFSMFVLEHLKHHSMAGIMSECYRITKHDGVNVHLVPNLKAACASLGNLETWTPENVRLIFAGDDPMNELSDYHHTGWSPQLAVDMFKEAGFDEVVVWEYPRYHLEMIIEAWKN